MISVSKISPLAFDSVFGGNEIENVINNNTELVNGWTILTQWITPKNTLQELNDDVVKALDLFPLIESQLMEFYEDSVRKHFTEHLSFITLSSESVSDNEDSLELVRVAATLKDAQKHYFHPLTIVPFRDFFRESFERTFKSLVREHIPYHILRRKMMSYFSQNHIHEYSPETEEVYKTFSHYGLKDESEKILAEIAISEIEWYFGDVYQQVWDTSIIESFKEWIETVFIPSLENLLSKGREQEVYEEEVMGQEESSNTLILIGEKILCDIRTEQLFDIVIDFPNSTPAVDDLKSCLKKPSQRASVVSIFQKSCSKRLLQGGANTVDILSAYISTVQVFTILDPKGVLLEKVSRPIRRYLKDREDTINVLVSGMLGQESSEIKFLSDILSKSKDVTSYDEQIDDLLDSNWYPDPIDAPVDFIRTQSGDLIDSLISLYENKDIFVKEIVNIFADRMLSEKNSVDEIVLCVEMLKLRFGERELQSLDVMLKDVIESKAINDRVQQEAGNVSGTISSIILSRLFWPSFRNQEINLPKSIENELDKFSESFSKLKRNRKLQWLKNLGQVDIEVEFEDRVRSFTVNPSQAAAIWIFEDGNSRTLNDVKNDLGISDDYARSILSFWANKGVLIKDNGSYRVLERLEGAQEGQVNDEVAVSSVQSAEERTNEEMKVYWSYIVGMLTNLGATPIARIHSFLKVLVPSEINYTKSQDELERYLSLKVDEEELEFTGGNYKLKNN